MASANGDTYEVIKDRNSVLGVVKSFRKTASTIASPFKRKEDAENIKANDNETPQGVRSVTTWSLSGETGKIENISLSL